MVEVAISPNIAVLDTTAKLGSAAPIAIAPASGANPSNRSCAADTRSSSASFSVNHEIVCRYVSKLFACPFLQLGSLISEMARDYLINFTHHISRRFHQCGLVSEIGQLALNLWAQVSP